MDRGSKIFVCPSKVLRVDTAKALASDHWLSICSYSVEEFLQMDHLDVREVDLVKALVRWGKFQLQNDKDDPEDGQKLRAKILPGLKHIRFSSLIKKESILCLELLDGVLSVEEKHSISNMKWKQLPSAVFASASVARRKKPHVILHLTNCCTTCSASGFLHDYEKVIKRSTELQVDKRAELVGLNFDGTRNFVEWRKNFNFELMNAQNKVIGKGNLRKDVSHDGQMFFKLTPKCILEANTKYTLVFNYSRPLHVVRCQCYTIHRGSSATADWLTLKVASLIKFIEMKGISMLFIKAY
jgi:hypothetical protein